MQALWLRKLKTVEAEKYKIIYLRNKIIASLKYSI